jgi:hypothetical protein
MIRGWWWAKAMIQSLLGRGKNLVLEIPTLPTRAIKRTACRVLITAVFMLKGTKRGGWQNNYEQFGLVPFVNLASLL